MSRMPGHELQREGAPYVKVGRKVSLMYPGEWSTRGSGRALCSCDWVSEILPSGARRKEAHRQHKVDVLMTQVIEVEAEARKRRGAPVEDVAWTPQRVRVALESLPIDGVDVWWGPEADVLVRMDFSILLKLVDVICGSMSEDEALCTAEDLMRERLLIAEITAEAMRRTKLNDERENDRPT